MLTAILIVTHLLAYALGLASMFAYIIIKLYRH